MFNLILNRPDKALNSKALDDIEDLAEEVRNDIEHLHQCFKELDKYLEPEDKRYLFSAELVTYFDIMLYHELSQVLVMAQMFRESSRSKLYSDMKDNNPDHLEIDLLKDFSKLTAWYNISIMQSVAGGAIKKFNTQFRDILEE